MFALRPSGNCTLSCNRRYVCQSCDLRRETKMNIDFDKSHPAVNIEDKRNLYVGFVRASIISIVLLCLLMLFMFVFRT
ncbi:MAG: hypothetical protein ACI9XZ_002501 [Alphaproteobacteria bacterium]|jgi:hypothetical protein